MLEVTECLQIREYSRQLAPTYVRLVDCHEWWLRIGLSLLRLSRVRSQYIVSRDASVTTDLLFLWLSRDSGYIVR